MKHTHVSQNNLSDFISLVQQQAHAHETSYTGDDQDFLAVLTANDNNVHAQIAYSDDNKQALGYILYTINDTLRGKQLYLEDILVRNDIRSAAVGKALFSQLKQAAHDADVDVMNWCADRRNEAAHNFYINKQAAKVCKNKLNTDITPIIRNKFNRAADPDEISQPVVKLNEDNILKHLNQIDSQTITTLTKAVQNIGSHIFAALDDNNQAQIILAANPHYSSFRTQFGYHADILDLDIKNPLTAIISYQNLINELGQTISENDHVYLNIDKHSPTQTDFAQISGLAPLTLTSDNTSQALCYSLKSDNFNIAAP